MSMASEFKEFIMRGNVVDLAVGVIIGGAFGKIVSSLVDQVIMPPIGLLTSGVDFSQFDPDGPIPDLAVNAARSTTAMHLGPPNGATLREALSGPPPGIDLVGTVDTVAAKMGEYMQEAEGDGYLISGPVHRRYIAEIADGLAPALKKRQMIRDHYRHDHLRDTLQEF